MGIEHSLSQEKSLLHSAKGERIILDEAHFVKSRRCNTAKVVLTLESLYKWALSGTPLHNRVGELYSLVRFLQVVPYSYYLCKDCDCRTLDYSSSTQCSNCPHNSVRHFCWWNTTIRKCESQAQFNTYVQAGTVMNNYAHILDLLIRMRQAVDHPHLMVYSSTAAQRAMQKQCFGCSKY